MLRTLTEVNLSVHLPTISIQRVHCSRRRWQITGHDPQFEARREDKSLRTGDRLQIQGETWLFPTIR